MPFLDLAYQGFAEGIDADAGAVRAFAAATPPVFVSSSFSKSFSLYGERVGALSIVAASADEAARTLSQLKRVVRTNYSNPPTHGGRIVATVLAQPGAPPRSGTRSSADAPPHPRCASSWSRCCRRAFPAATSLRRRQRGIFSYSGLTKAQVDAARAVLDLRDRLRPHLRRGAQHARIRGTRRGDFERDPLRLTACPVGIRQVDDWFRADRPPHSGFDSRPLPLGLQITQRGNNCSWRALELPRLRSGVRDPFPHQFPKRARQALPFRLPEASRTRGRPPGRGGRVVMQRPAKPSTPVRFRPPPPFPVPLSGTSPHLERTLPVRPLSPYAPTIAVLPSPESATDHGLAQVGARRTKNCEPLARPAPRSLTS